VDETEALPLAINACAERVFRAVFRERADTACGELLIEITRVASGGQHGTDGRVDGFGPQLRPIYGLKIAVGFNLHTHTHTHNGTDTHKHREEPHTHTHIHTHTHTHRTIHTDV